MKTIKQAAKEIASELYPKTDKIAEYRYLLRNLWIREKKSKRELKIIEMYPTADNNLNIWHGNYFITNKELLEDYEFLDGTVCGKKIENYK